MSEQKYVFESTDKYLHKTDDVLVGRTFRLAMDDGHEYELRFVTGEIVEWRAPGEPLHWETYHALKSDEKTTFVASILANAPCRTCITLVLDEENSLVTMGISRMGCYPDRPRLADVRFVFGAIRVQDQPLPYKRHSYTADLVGKKITWYYSTGFVNTHIYMSERFTRIRPKENPKDTTTVENAIQDEKERSAGTRPEPMLYDEPTRFIKIKEGVYLVSFIEDNMNRNEPDRGGNNLMLLMNLKEGSDCGRTFSMSRDQKPEHGMFRSYGEFTDEDIDLEHLPTPYRV